MICFPNAKINLGLNIISRRADGYHNLETLFYPIGLRDALEIVPSDREEDFRLFQTGATIQGDKDDNLVIKALKLISEEKKIPGIDIHLFKKIPFGAGLGGGSSDAAFMLKLLNDTFSLGYTVPELEQKAAEIGADCPFFIKNKPAFAKGTGNLLEELEGKLPDDKEKLLGIIDRYFDLPEDERIIYRLGRRKGIYRKLDDMSERRVYTMLKTIVDEYKSKGMNRLDRDLDRIMHSFI